MQSNEYLAVTYQGAAYCLNHVPKGVTGTEVTPIFADSEWDSYPYCDKCRKVFTYVSLTGQGGSDGNKSLG